MRKELEHFWGEEIRFLAIRTRDRLSLTQRKMSERLVMSESSYSDIETGRTNSGMLTTILLLRMNEDPNQFLCEAGKRSLVWEQVQTKMRKSVVS